jgi:hypothetical protein
MFKSSSSSSSGTVVEGAPLDSSSLMQGKGGRSGAAGEEGKISVKSTGMLKGASCSKLDPEGKQLSKSANGWVAELLTAVESDPSKGSKGDSSNAGKGRAIEQ